MGDLAFRYVAVDDRGRRQSGRLEAADEASAFTRLRRDGLSPLSLKCAGAERPAARTVGPSDRDSAEFLVSLAELLRAGADIRTALGILGSRFDRASVKRLAERLTNDIGGGEALDVAFAGAFSRNQAFIAPLVAAGEASGDLPGGLERASQVIQSRLKLRDQLVSVMAYPTFVFISAIGALFVILLFIVPSIAPLTEELGAEPPAALAVMMAASNFLQTSGHYLLAGLLGLALTLYLAARGGLLNGVGERLVLDGPARRTIGGVVYGAFAVSLGTMLAAGAPIAEALRLATRSVPNAGARKRLEPVADAVRQGEALSDALGEVRGFPSAIVRLAAVGEASNAVGPLLIRSGRLEEETALKRIEGLGRIAGPILIILLGMMLGVLMAGLLSGVSQLGQPLME